MEGEEGARRPVEASEEVNDDVEEEDTSGREREVGQEIGNGNSGGPIEAVFGLLLQDWAASHLTGHLSEGVQACREQRGEDNTTLCELAIDGVMGGVRTFRG